MMMLMMTNRLAAPEVKEMDLALLMVLAVGGVMAFALCVSLMFVMLRRRKRNSGARQILPEDSVCGASYPILNGHSTTLHDFIEMTTSGSGSGKLDESVFTLLYFFYVFFI